MGWTKSAAYSRTGAVFGVIPIITLLVITLGVKERIRPELRPARMPAWSQYALGLAIASAAIVAAFLPPVGSSPWIYGKAFVAGVGFSAQYVFPWNMIPDAIEVDQAVMGERHEGIYMGVNAFLGKLTGALGIAASCWALKLYGYVPDAVQTQQALFGIRFFFAIVPVIAFVAALPLLIWYPITREKPARLAEKP